MDSRIRGKLITRKGEFIFEYLKRYHQHLDAETFVFEVWSEELLKKRIIYSSNRKKS